MQKSFVITAITLGFLSSAALAQPNEMRRIIESLMSDPEGDVSRMAQAVLGERGGDALFYLPTRDQPQTPARWNFEYEDVHFKSTDGTPLHGWFLPARTGQPKGTVVFSHGNAGSIGHHLGFVMWLAEAGYQVFMYDYRGFGKSGGTVDRRGMIEDVQAAFRHIAARPDVDTGRLTSFGHSMGGAKSIAALAEARPPGLRAVVIDGTFSCYREMARLFAGEVGGNLTTADWSPLAHVARIAPVPLLVVHGDQDEVVPVLHGRELFKAAGNPKTLFEVRQGRHGDALSRDNGAFRRKTLEWLEKNLAN